MVPQGTIKLLPFSCHETVFMSEFKPILNAVSPF